MRRLLLILLGVGLVFVGVGVVTARQDPLVVRYTIEMPGLQRPIRVVQLSDSHASRIDMPPQRLARVVATMNALRPDLIVLTGDYVSGNPDRWDATETAAAVAPFAALRAPLGVFAVLGNHDDRYKTAAAFGKGRVRLLVGQRVDLGPLLLVGTDSILGGSPAVEAMRRAIRRAPAGRPMLVIAHEPNFFHWLQRRPVVLLVGHTHGGQIRLPLLGSWIPDRYSAEHRRGEFRSGFHTMLVTSGLGTSILPLRIGVPPEIVEVMLVPGQAGRKSGTDR